MIVVSEFMDDASVARLAEAHEVHFDTDLADKPDELAVLLHEARALIVRNRTRVTPTLLASAPHLDCIGRLGVGLDNIDVAACRDRGIAVFPATGANALSVAEYVVTAALVLRRGAWFANAGMLAGEWPRSECSGRELAGSLLGLVGFGAIARATAARARALGMRVAACDPFVPPDDPAWDGIRSLSLEALLAKADVVSLHVPLTVKTRHLIDAGALSLMKPDAILINVARGGVVAEEPLADALRRGRVGGAALDVFETEPLTEAAARRFAGLPNLILTPHVAGITEQSNARVGTMIADRIIAHLAQETEAS